MSNGRWRLTLKVKSNWNVIFKSLIWKFGLDSGYSMWVLVSTKSTFTRYDLSGAIRILAHAIEWARVNKSHFKLRLGLNDDEWWRQQYFSYARIRIVACKRALTRSKRRSTWSYQSEKIIFFYTLYFILRTLTCPCQTWCNTHSEFGWLARNFGINIVARSYFNVCHVG